MLSTSLTPKVSLFQGKGFEVSMHGCSGGPTSIVFEQLEVVGGGNAGFYLHLPATNASSLCVGGAVLRNSRTTGTSGPGVYVYETGYGALSLDVTAVVVNASRNPTGMYVKSDWRYVTGGLTVSNTSVYTRSGSPWLVMTTDSQPVTDVSIDATVHARNKSACVPVLVSPNHSSNVHVKTTCDGLGGGASMLQRRTKSDDGASALPNASQKVLNHLTAQFDEGHAMFQHFGVSTFQYNNT